MVKKKRNVQRRFGSAYGRCVLREIKGSFGRFIAIIGIVALGVGFLLGVLSTTPDLKASMDRYYEQQGMCNLFIKSTLGLTQEDADQIRAMEEVEALTPAYEQDIIIETEEEEAFVARVIGTDLADNASSQGINQLTLEEGRLPQSAGECVVEKAWGDRTDLPVGTKLSISKDNANYDQIGDTFRAKDYTVVGIVSNPFYISSDPEVSSIGNGRVGVILYTPETSFAMEVYTDFWIRLKDASRYEFFSGAYEDFVSEQKEIIQKTADERAAKRYQEVHQKGADELAQAEEEWRSGKETAEQELSQADLDLQSARETLESSEKQLTEAQLQLDASWKQLEEGRAELDAGWAKIQASQTAYENGQAEYSTAKAQYEEGQAAFDAAYGEYQEAVIDYRVGEIELETARTQYEQIQGIYEVFKQQLEGAADLDLQLLVEKLEKLKNLLPAGDTVFLDQLIEYLKKGEIAESQIQELLTMIESAMGEMEKQISDGEQQLEAAKQQLEEGEAQLSVNKGQLSAANKQLITAEVRLELAEGELSEGTETLNVKEAEYAQGLEDYKQGLADYEKGKQDLKQGWQDYEQGVQQLETKRQEAEQQIADGEKQIKNARVRLDEMESSWYVLDLNANVGYASFKINVEKVADIAKIFPVFFFIVSALVTLTTMTRMIEEERTQIGTLKALGYSKAKILGKYLIYCGLATILGCLIGMTAGFRLLPALIRNSYSTLYRLPPLILRFDWFYALLSCAAEFACTLGATLGACLYSLKEKPAYLMLPRVPKAGQRILLEKWKWLWGHLSFSYKATARNIFRYKKHLLMTVVGIGGCTALMLAAFGVRNSMSKIITNQYQEILQYDLKLSTDGTQDSILQTYLQDKPYTAVTSLAVTAVKGDESASATLMVAEDATKFPEFVQLYNRLDKAELEFTDSSVVLSEKLADQLGVSAGEAFQLEKANGKQAEVTVTGITENYVGIYVYMGSQLYEQIFGEVSANTLLIQSGTEPSQQDQEITGLLASSSVTGGEFKAQSQESYNNLLYSMNFIVLVLIIAACGLAVIVLYNLTNININERMKELATLRVLGYHHREVGAYIFREINLLSTIGAAFGLLLGKLLHYYIIIMAESTELMFGRSISWVSYVSAFAVTLLISFLVDALMLIKLKRIRMVDSMKAVD